MTDTSDAWLRVRGLSKQFGGVLALSAVDVDIHRGEVHGLVGANGAGKSTLIRALAGIVPSDGGTVSIDGEERRLASPRDAERAGLAFIHQELKLVPHFSTIENVLLGAPKAKRFGMVEWKAMRKVAVQATERIGIDFRLDLRVDELSVAQRWLVMISKALIRETHMIAMDEPTASLSDHESEDLFRVIRDLASDGVAILYVSHRLDEVLELSDRITVFRDGTVTDTAVRGDLDKRGLIRAIVGREMPVVSRDGTRAEVDRTGQPIFAARNVARGKAVQGISFELHRGEILGLGGLVGAGRTELARLAFGADKLESGSFDLEGAPLSTRNVAHAVAQGLALVPEERRSEGLLLEKSVAYNMNIAALRSLRSVPALPFISDRKSRNRAKTLVDLLQIKTAGLNQPIGGLSGGNQQKALIARWLSPEVKVLFLDEPSRGVDIGARHEIHQTIRDLADNGIGTVVISSDVEELAALCDRIIVLSEGHVSGELVGDEITENRIIELSYAHDETAHDETAHDETAHDKTTHDRTTGIPT